jgi:multimeric flavodoxin WrbA
MKITGFVGSPCKNGNVDLLVSQVLEGAATQGVETRKIYLNNLRIQPCQSCGTDPHPKHCLFDDAMNQIYDALETSDVIALGSPVYFDTVSAQVKLIIDARAISTHALGSLEQTMYRLTFNSYIVTELPSSSTITKPVIFWTHPKNPSTLTRAPFIMSPLIVEINS